jgi:hypothetical protein
MTQDLSLPKKKTDIKVIALAIVCVILAAGLVGVVTFYQPVADADKDATIASLHAQIADLQQQLASATSDSSATQQISSLQNQITDLKNQLSVANDTITSYYSQLTNYAQIVALEASSVLNEDSITQDANTSTSFWTGTPNYASYLTVAVESNSSTTYAEITYSFTDHVFNYNQTVGTSGTAIFPVLPGETQLLLGNHETSDAVSINATATLIY